MIDEQKILLGQVTRRLSNCSIHQIGQNLDMLSPSQCNIKNGPNDYENGNGLRKGHELITIIFACK